MNSEQREAILRMIVYPGGQHPLDRDGFIAATGIADPEVWAREELARALDDRSPDDVELAITLGNRLGMDGLWVDPLIAVLFADWTHSHEDAAEALGELREPRAIPALVRAAHWVPVYLEYDEGRSLAAKAISSLGQIPGSDAALALDDLRTHEDRPLRDRVERAIERRTAS